MGLVHLRSADQGCRARYHGQGEARPRRRRPLPLAQLPLGTRHFYLPYGAAPRAVRPDPAPPLRHGMPACGAGRREEDEEAM